MTTGFIRDITAAIQESEKDGRLMMLEGVTGLSGNKLVGLLQRAAVVASRDPRAAYLEIGVFQGLTLTSVAAAAPALSCYGIDNFSQFDTDGRNCGITRERLARHTGGNAHLINADFEAALLGLRDHIGERRLAVYFIDGPHDYRSQYLCLDFARPCLAKDAVILVDDSNYEHVRRANADWLRANPDYALLFESYTDCHPNNMTPEVETAARAGWWNGINVIVHDPERTLERIYPPLATERDRYFNDHIVHSEQYAELAPRLLSAFGAPLPRALLRLLRLLLGRHQNGRHAHVNTYSAGLPSRTAAERTSA